MKNQIKYFLYKYSFSSRKKKIIKSFNYMKKIKTVLIENGICHEVSVEDMDKIKNINLKISGKKDKTNQLIIELPQNKKLNIRISFESQNNTISFEKNCKGDWFFGLYSGNNKCSVGSETEISSCFISLINNELKIGKNCMFSNNIHIWGDGHSVLSYPFKQVLNKPTNPIVIGDHCWIGERVTITKNANIPNDCIVGIASVVTKKFEEEHIVLAGAPAKIVKHGVTWNGLPPLEYEKINNN